MLLCHSLRHSMRDIGIFSVCAFFRSLVLLLYIHILTIYIFLFVLSYIFFPDVFLLALVLYTLRRLFYSD
jgi:hypothetical protein